MTGVRRRSAAAVTLLNLSTAALTGLAVLGGLNIGCSDSSAPGYFENQPMATPSKLPDTGPCWNMPFKGQVPDACCDPATGVVALANKGKPECGGTNNEPPFKNVINKAADTFTKTETHIQNAGDLVREESATVLTESQDPSAAKEGGNQDLSKGLAAQGGAAAVDKTGTKSANASGGSGAPTPDGKPAPKLAGKFTNGGGGGGDSASGPGLDKTSTQAAGGDSSSSASDSSADTGGGTYGSGRGGSNDAGGANGGTSVDGSSGSSEIEFGAKKDEDPDKLGAKTNPSGSDDPADYFSRLSSKDSLFVIIEKRYRKKERSWVSEDLDRQEKAVRPAKTKRRL